MRVRLIGSSERSELKVTNSKAIEVLHGDGNYELSDFVEARKRGASALALLVDCEEVLRMAREEHICDTPNCARSQCSKVNDMIRRISAISAETYPAAALAQRRAEALECIRELADCRGTRTGVVDWSVTVPDALWRKVAEIAGGE